MFAGGAGGYGGVERLDAQADAVDPELGPGGGAIRADVAWAGLDGGFAPAPGEGLEEAAELGGVE